MEISQQLLCVCEERAGPAGPFSDTEQDPEQDPELDYGYWDLAHVKPVLLGWCWWYHERGASAVSEAESKKECLAVPEACYPARMIPTDKSKVLDLRNGLNNIADKGNTTELWPTIPYTVSP